MQVQINLDALTERYVRSKETQAEVYKARAWSMAAFGLMVGIIIGMGLALWMIDKA